MDFGFSLSLRGLLSGEIIKIVCFVAMLFSAIRKTQTLRQTAKGYPCKALRVSHCAAATCRGTLWAIVIKQLAVRYAYDA